MLIDGVTGAAVTAAIILAASGLGHFADWLDKRTDGRASSILLLSFTVIVGAAMGIIIGGQQ